MNIYLTTIEYLLRLAALLIALVFIAWAVVTLAVLADTGYLLRAGKPNRHLGKRDQPSVSDKGNADEHQKKAA